MGTCGLNENFWLKYLTDKDFARYTCQTILHDTSTKTSLLEMLTLLLQEVRNGHAAKH